MASNLQAIRDKVRRITRTPSPAQLTDAQIDEYINTFILYDLPEQLRLFSLRSTLTFYTQPNVDRYSTNTTVTTDPLYNFKNKYIAIHPPLFIAGVQSYYTQRRDVFYGNYPQFNSISDTTLRGTGGVGPFTGTLSARPVLQNNVVFTCLDTSSTGMVIVDYPVSNTLGALGIPGQPQTLPSPYGQINYVTGAYTLVFPGNTLTSAIVYSETIPYQAGKPYSVLFYDETFTIRPVPDNVYAVQMDVDLQPTELINAADEPNLQQQWQYIALGSSKKIFEDRLDYESVQLIMPTMKEQEEFCLRSTLTQKTNERTVTIYTIGKQYSSSQLGFWGSGWPY
jgi:hypothetical protein